MLTLLFLLVACETKLTNEPEKPEEQPKTEVVVEEVKPVVDNNTLKAMGSGPTGLEEVNGRIEVKGKFKWTSEKRGNDTWYFFPVAFNERPQDVEINGKPCPYEGGKPGACAFALNKVVYVANPSEQEPEKITFKMPEAITKAEMALRGKGQPTFTLENYGQVVFAHTNGVTIDVPPDKTHLKFKPVVVDSPIFNSNKRLKLEVTAWPKNVENATVTKIWTGEAFSLESEKVELDLSSVTTGSGVVVNLRSISSSPTRIGPMPFFSEFELY